MKNIDYIKRDIAIREAWSALSDVLKETPLGKDIIKNHGKHRASSYSPSII